MLAPTLTGDGQRAETPGRARTRGFALDLAILAACGAIALALFTHGGLEALAGGAIGAALGARKAGFAGAISGAFAGLFVGALFAGFFHGALAAVFSAF